MNCPGCDMELRSGARFCDGCGLPKDPTCSSCGTQLRAAHAAYLEIGAGAHAQRLAGRLERADGWKSPSGLRFARQTDE